MSQTVTLTFNVEAARVRCEADPIVRVCGKPAHRQCANHTTARALGVPLCVFHLGYFIDHGIIDLTGNRLMTDPDRWDDQGRRRETA